MILKTFDGAICGTNSRKARTSQEAIRFHRNQPQDDLERAKTNGDERDFQTFGIAKSAPHRTQFSRSIDRFQSSASDAADFSSPMNTKWRCNVRIIFLATPGIFLQKRATCQGFSARTLKSSIGRRGFSLGANAMAELVLHTPSQNKNAFKALIAAEILGVKISVSTDFQMGVTNKTPKFLKLNPMGKIPVLETPDGPVSESNAIARYVANLKSKLTGSSVYEKALVDQWVDFAALEIDVNLGPRWVYARMGYAPYSAEVEASAISNVRRALGAMNTYLASRTYLAGDFVTLADIVMVCNLSFGYMAVFSQEFTEEFPHVDRYFFTLVRQPAFKKHFGDVFRCSRVIPGPPEAKQAKPSKPKVEAKPKEEPAKPKEEAPKPKQETFEEEEEAPKPKAKNSLDLLPPSPMVLDNWKRLYSNTKAKDFAEVALKGFWDMYDPEGFSMWFCDYKYSEENNVPFVTMNKVSGFLQRMDFARKHAFAKMCILGDGAPYKIKGVWLFRGPEIPEQVKSECYDLELYEWTKVDITDPVQKERVNAYFEEPDVVDGEKLLEAKCFK